MHVPEPSPVPPAEPADGSPPADVAPPDRRGGSLPRAPLLAAVLVVVLAGGGLFAAGFALGTRTASQPGTPGGEAELFGPFWDTYTAVTEHYAGEPVTHRQVVAGAIKGMLGSLGDPFSFYMSPADFKNSLEGLAGQFEGIGATLTSHGADGSAGCTPLGSTCSLDVVSVIPGAPAARAGLLAGDRVVAVDKQSVDGSTVDATLARVRGPSGTVVTITFVRGKTAPRDLAITRAVIVQPEVTSRTLADGRVGYVQLRGYSDSASRDFANALRDHVTSGRRLIVLDLRGNPGGYLVGARAVASQFIGSGPIYWEEAAGQAPIASAAAPDGVAIDRSIKLAVLVDKGTASASEVVAGALQDTHRGTLVGQQTYGKGTIQEFLALDADTGGFRLTIARWLTPNQRWINKTGLTPDVVVPAPASGSSPGTPGADPVLDRALEVLGIPAGAATSASIGGTA